MGRRKTNIKRKKAARKKKLLTARMEREKQQIFRQCFRSFMQKIEDERKKQEAYRWN